MVFVGISDCEMENFLCNEIDGCVIGDCYVPVDIDGVGFFTCRNENGYFCGIFYAAMMVEFFFALISSD